MMIRELNGRECHEVLGRATIARLATAKDDQPYVVPVHIYFDGRDLYSFATLGRKIDWMRANPKVCVEVEEVADTFQWRTVIVLGRYEELVHAPSYEEFRQRARELFSKRPEWWQPASTPIRKPEFRMPVIYRVRIDQITGRSASRPAPGGTHGGTTTPWWLPLMFTPVRDSE